MMKKVLMLGGTSSQAFAIKEARAMGHYVISCDYLPSNPGHQYSNEYHNISTTDINAVLKLASDLNVDAIVAYASDPAAPTAAYVSEILGLPTSPYKSIEILSKKDLFRKFLLDNGFNVPKAKGYFRYEDAFSDIDTFKLPIMVKPVDSSGSKGINKLTTKSQLKAFVDEALYYSRDKRFLLEEYIEKKGSQISGDAFSVNGKLQFHCFGDEFYNNMISRDFVPLGECWPSSTPKKTISLLIDILQKIITILGMKTNAYNVEAIVDKEDNIYVLELGARSGGSLIPQITHLATGVNLVTYVIKGALGDDCSDLKMVEPLGFWSNYMLHSKNDGIFKEFQIKDSLKKNIVTMVTDVQPGDKVNKFRNAGDALGTIILKYSSKEEMITKIRNMDDYIHSIIE